MRSMEVAMVGGLKSFKRDWDRWSVSERLFAAGFLAATAIALIGGAINGATP